jgi:hypothetical protein
MNPTRLGYRQARALMAPGDVLIFGGEGLVSWLVKRATRSNASHSGIVSFCLDTDKHHRVRVTDSTQIGRRCGVFTRYLSDVLREYPGQVWWLPLGFAERARLDELDLAVWLDRMAQTRYDLVGAVRAGLRAVCGRGLFPLRESDRRVFCSEFCAVALENAGVWDWKNTSEVTPVDLAFTPIFGACYQLKGRSETIWRESGGRREELQVVQRAAARR